MEITMGIADDEEEWSGSAGYEWWNELPQDLQDEALAWLPVDSLITYRGVSREWNALLSSTRFLGGSWVEAPVNRKPWLLLWQQGSPQGCRSYSFYRATWKVGIFFSFLTREDILFLRGSEAGRLIVMMRDPLSLLSFSVCNPYTQRSIKLPFLPSIKTVFSCCVFEDKATNNNNGVDIYKVVAMGLGNATDIKIVEVYDSSVKSWRMAGQIPEDLDTKYHMVFCDGYFYCLTMELRPVRIPRILVFSIQDGGEMRMSVEPMPEVLLDSGRQMFRLITCGSRVLMVSARMEVIIWEFQKNSSNSSWYWKEIVRMPASLSERMKNLSGMRGGVVGVADSVCFISMSGTAAEVLVYYLNEKSWSWLPSCPLDLDQNRGINGMAFQPRPDMKIE